MKKIVVKDWIYVNTDDNGSRFVLGTKGCNPLVCLGVNPHTATPHKLDKTVGIVEKIALNNSFDSFIMLNIYPQRAIKTKYIDSCINEELHEINIEHIKKIFNKKAYTILAAWGTSIEKKTYLKDCLKEIVKVISESNQNHIWKALKKGDNLTKEGHPFHPSRGVSSKSPLVPFCLEEYAYIQ
ncbi:MAG: DUF1643 domain-containing protein [Defluviitaleaceae bacterium]|nr:DUF1643 domain-containing protein [Defluviitaleaceae bacterium]